MIVAHGASSTAIVRTSAGQPVVLLAGELPEVLSPADHAALLNLAAAVLTPQEMQLFHRCLASLRRGDNLITSRVEIEGVALTVYRENERPQPPPPRPRPA